MFDCSIFNIPPNDGAEDCITESAYNRQAEIINALANLQTPILDCEQTDCFDICAPVYLDCSGIVLSVPTVNSIFLGTHAGGGRIVLSQRAACLRVAVNVEPCDKLASNAALGGVVQSDPTKYGADVIAIALASGFAGECVPVFLSGSQRC